MGRSRILRLLRIAFSAVCGIACVLLMVLWVRSYFRLDSLLVRVSPTHVVDVGSINGGLLLQFRENDFSRGWLRKSHPITGRGIARSPFRFGSEFRSIHSGIQIPHWSVVASAVLIAVAPWIRFSLRTLLIATTLVAVVLRLAVAFR
jgi:hypothetical protein